MPKNLGPIITKKVLPLAQNSPAYYSLNLSKAAGWLLLGIDLCVRGNIVLSAGTTNGTRSQEDPAGIFNNIQIDATPMPGGLYRGGKVFNASPRSILRMNVFDRGRFQDDLGGSNSVTGAAGTFPINLRLPINFALPNGLKPIDTALRLDQFSDITMTFNMSSIAAMLVGCDRTVDWTQLYIEVVERRAYSVNAAKKTGFWPLGTLFQDDHFFQIAAANNRFTIDSQLPHVDPYVEALLMTQSTAQNTLVDTILNRVTQYQGLESFSDIFERDLRMLNNDEITEVANTALTGMYFLRLSDRRLSNLVLPTYNLVLDVNNPGGANLDSLLLFTRRLAQRLGNPPQ